MYGFGFHDNHILGTTYVGVLSDFKVFYLVRFTIEYIFRSITYE
jgi:hypothetical protein